MNIILFDTETMPTLISSNEEAGRHILNVLGLKRGDTFRCGLVNGSPGIGVIEEISGGNIVFKWEKTGEKKDLYPLTLIVGYTRPVSSKRILREAASLGAERIIFTGTDTGEKSYRLSNLWKTGEYRRYLVDGARQAGETSVPEVLFFTDVRRMLESIPPETEADFMVLDNERPERDLSLYNPGNAGVFLAIGSERGWSDTERQLFKNRGFVSLRLGRRILRTETACSAGITLALSRMGYL